MKTFSEWNKIYEEKKSNGYVLRQRFDNLFESIADEFGVDHVAELTDYQFSQFIQLLEQYWFGQKYLNESVFDKDSRPLMEAEIKDDKSFREYAEKVLKKAHGDNYDKDIAKETMDGLLDKYGKDYGAAIGALQSGLAESYELLEDKISSDDEFREYAEKVLKKAHGDNYDQSIADDTISGILDKYPNDYGAAVGALTSGLAN